MGKVAAVHQLQEHPDPIVILEHLFASDDVWGIQMTDQAALINDTLTLWLALASVLKHDFFTTNQALTFEDGGKAAFAYRFKNLVVLLGIKRLDLDRAGNQSINLFKGSHAVHLLPRLHQNQAQANVRVLMDVPSFELLLEQENVCGIEASPLNTDIVATLLHDKWTLEILRFVCAVNELKCWLVKCSDLYVFRKRRFTLILWNRRIECYRLNCGLDYSVYLWLAFF